MFDFEIYNSNLIQLTYRRKTDGGRELRERWQYFMRKLLFFIGIRYHIYLYY